MATKKKSVKKTNPLYNGAAKCDCPAKFNEALAKQGHNTKVITTLFTGKCALYVEKADSKVRQKPINVIANYCPFCGKKYPE